MRLRKILKDFRNKSLTQEKKLNKLFYRGKYRIIEDEDKIEEIVNG
jgi:hypothetical protein